MRPLLATFLALAALFFHACSGSGSTSTDTGGSEDVLLWPDHQAADQGTLLDVPPVGDKDQVAPVDVLPDGSVADLLDSTPDEWVDAVEPEDLPAPDLPVTDLLPEVVDVVADTPIEPDLPTPEEGSWTESFDDAAMADGAATTALWGVNGQLQPQAQGFGDGSDGPFEPQVDTELDTANGPFLFTSLHIPEGVTVTATGSLPLDLRVQGEASIEGTIDLSGANGEDALDQVGGTKPLGGLGGAGGSAGGLGGPGGTEPGQAGAGDGGGGPGIAVDVVTFVGSGGGGGFGAPGGQGLDWSANEAYSGAGGTPYGSAELDELMGGSGGGGGGPRDNTPGDPAAGGNGLIDAPDNPGGGGGGGGGAVAVRAGGTITLSGRISVDGGDGGIGDFSGGGGGGSGGAILLESAGSLVLAEGVLSARGGSGNRATDTNQLAETIGGNGGGGRIVLRSGIPVTEGLVKNPEPIPSWGEAQVVDGGDGSDGAFTPLLDTELDTSAGPFFYTTVTIPEGVTVTAVGNLPLEIYSEGNMDIFGTVDVSGLAGGTSYSACCNQPGPAVAGAGGVAGPGGFRGGAGGDTGDGEDGQGPGGGAGSLGTSSFAGGGGGGGYGAPGQVGGCPEEAAGGTVYGEHDLAELLGGSGGGGAGLTPVAGANPGSGGGGGGGAVRMECGGMLQMQGTIRANGGPGGEALGSGSGGSFGAGGGGGSGGGILIRSLSVRDFGRYEALGGPAGPLKQGGGCVASPNVPGQGRGGHGGVGRIRFETTVPVGFVFPEEGSLHIDSYATAYGKVAVSLFYDSGVACPDYGAVELLPVGMAQEVAIEYEGAPGVGDEPDPSQSTGWQLSPHGADCHRFLRFKLTFLDWGGGEDIPVLESIKVPYTWVP